MRKQSISVINYPKIRYATAKRTIDSRNDFMTFDSIKTSRLREMRHTCISWFLASIAWYSWYSIFWLVVRFFRLRAYYCMVYTHGFRLLWKRCFFCLSLFSLQYFCVHCFLCIRSIPSMFLFGYLIYKRILYLYHCHLVCNLGAVWTSDCEVRVH